MNEYFDFSINLTKKKVEQIYQGRAKYLLVVTVSFTRVLKDLISSGDRYSFRLKYYYIFN